MAKSQTEPERYQECNIDRFLRDRGRCKQSLSWRVPSPPHLPYHTAAQTHTHTHTQNLNRPMPLLNQSLINKWNIEQDKATSAPVLQHGEETWKKAARPSRESASSCCGWEPEPPRTRASFMATLNFLPPRLSEFRCSDPK